MDHMHQGHSEEKRLQNRKTSVKPLVDSYFEWIHSLAENPVLEKGSALAKAITYSQNQEPYLRKFLENPIIPLDNNDVERSIRSVCVGKYSWHAIDSKDGAWASAVWYYLAETAKANGLKPYEYFQFQPPHEGRLFICTVRVVYHLLISSRILLPLRRSLSVVLV